MLNRLTPMFPENIGSSAPSSSHGALLVLRKGLPLIPSQHLRFGQRGLAVIKGRKADDKP